MSAVTEASVLDALRTVQEPELGGDLVTRNMIKDLVLTGSDVAFTIELTTPACPLKDQIEGEVRKAASTSRGERPCGGRHRGRRSSSSPVSRT
jgi:ATP-binding protein involved in chromosome partitioning